MTIRDASPADFPQILRLNLESEHFLSPLTPERLAQLHAQSAYHRVLDIDGDIAAFLLALREGASYDSPNYRWFAEHFDTFLYIDRVVVAASQQGRGIGKIVYEDLFAFARDTGATRVTCEFDVEPPNEASRRFHASMGFAEVGAQWVAGGKKRVSLQSASLQLS